MFLIYETKAQDLEAFYRHVYATRPHINGKFNLGRILLTAVVMQALLLLAVILEWSSEAILFLVCVPTLSVYFVIPLYADSQFSKTFSNPEATPDPDFPGQYKLFCDEVGLHESGTYFELCRKWPSVCSIETTPNHVFVFTGHRRCIIIPTRSIIEGDLDAFLLQIRAKIAEHRVGKGS